MKVSVALLLVAGASAEFSRTVIPFGGGWKFKLGDDPKGSGTGPNQCVFSRNVTGMACTGVETDPNRFTADDCRISCCYDPDCYVWQQYKTACYHGGKDAKCSKDDSAEFFDGGMRTEIAPYQVDYSYAQHHFDDSSWDTISVPHDFLINGTFTDSADIRHGFLPRKVGWYRKSFTIPATSKRSLLYFEGANHFKEVYLNGELHTTHKCGYTPFTVDLRNLTGTHEIAIRADATYGSGHWYEGGGLYRGVELHLIVNSTLRLNEMGGTFVDPFAYNDNRAKVSAEIVVDDLPYDVAATVTFTLTDPDDNSTIIGQAVSRTTIPSHSKRDSIIKVNRDVKWPFEMWSMSNPKLYDVTFSLSINNEVVDSLTSRTGFRAISWNTKGIEVNGINQKLKGFSHHNSFGGSGVMQSARLDLFRLRTSQALGANFFRMSHNPYDKNMYALLSAMGILCWDENRDFGIKYVDDFTTMIRAHRSFPAVSVWSFCNEYECVKYHTGNQTGDAFQLTAKTQDPFRNTTANMILQDMPYSPAMADVTGFSHSANSTFLKWHTEHPEKPLILSECCSCMTTRTSDREAGETCMPDQNSPMNLPYVAGSIGVWTLMDYFGESHKWPQVSSQFGQFDVSGFPKPHAWYYRRHWTDSSVSSKVSKLITMLVQNSTSISGVVGSPSAELFIDGKSEGVVDAGSTGVVQWKVPTGTLSVKNATLVNIYDVNPIKRGDTLLQPESAASIKFSVDVPSASTGTGSKLYLDGTDVALLHITLLDSKGTAVSQDAGQVNVTFEVVSGPAKILGVGNGDVLNHQKVLGNTMASYAGLVRVVVQITTDCVSPFRHLVSSVDSITGPITYADVCPTEPVVVRATTPSLPSTTVEIETSGLPQYSPLAAAAQRHVNYTYIDDVQS